MIVVSKHAEQRMKERLGLNKRSIARIAEKAYMNGIRRKDTKGMLSKWIDGVYLKNKNANNIRLYGDMLYIFCDNILVTVFQIPTNMRNNIDDFLKK